MKVHEIMTAHARCVGLDNTLVEAAGLMRELDVGALPVCDEDRLAGMVTDRDIVLRGVADGRDPNTTPVRDVMSQGVVYAFADQEVEEAVRAMEDRQIRRLPILSRDKRLVGIVSLGDIATSSSPMFSGNALRDVSQPATPSARQRRLQAASCSGATRRGQPSGDGTSENDGHERSSQRRTVRSTNRRTAQTRKKTSSRSRGTSSARKTTAARGRRRSATRSRG